MLTQIGIYTAQKLDTNPEKYKIRADVIKEMERLKKIEEKTVERIRKVEKNEIKSMNIHL